MFLSLGYCILSFDSLYALMGGWHKVNKVFAAVSDNIFLVSFSG